MIWKENYEKRNQWCYACSLDSAIFCLTDAIYVYHYFKIQYTPTQRNKFIIQWYYKIDGHIDITTSTHLGFL